MILPAPRGEAQGGVVIAEGILGWKAEIQSKPRLGLAAGENALPRNQALGSDWGSTLRLSQARRFGHKMEL